MFFDEAKIYIKGGDGGDGLMAFRREKYVPFGGPSGGDGGTGGDIIFVVNPKLNNLSYYHRNIHFKAGDGQRGGQNRMTGANGETLRLEVPPGTVIRNAETGAVLADRSSIGVGVNVGLGVGVGEGVTVGVAVAVGSGVGSAGVSATAESGVAAANSADSTSSACGSVVVLVEISKFEDDVGVAAVCGGGPLNAPLAEDLSLLSAESPSSSIASSASATPDVVVVTPVTSATGSSTGTPARKKPIINNKAAKAKAVSRRMRASNL